MISPRDPIIGFDARFVLQQPIEMKIKEQLSFSGDDFTVTDAVSGNLLFTVDGKAFSIGQKKDLLDYSGALFGTFRKKLLALGHKFEIADASGREIGVIKNQSFTLFDRAKMSLEFTNKANGDTVKLKLSGNWLDKHAEIICRDKHGEASVATLSRKSLTVSSLVFGKDTYVLVVKVGD
jgi:uncharacterized protein YxjI